MEPNPPSELQSPTLPSRRTRSQAPSDWSVQEMLLLVSEVAEIESDFMKTLSSHQKWKIISDNCAGVGVPKSLNQCRRKWEQLQAEYTKIKDWESQSDIDSYWSLESKVKMELGLPLSLDEEVFRTIDNQVKGPEDEVEESVGMGVGSESESADSKLNLTHAKNSGPKKKKLRHGHPQNITVEHKESIEHRKEEMVLKVNENVDLIHSILLQNMLKSRENMPDDSKNTEAETMEFRRWQADELIKVLGNLSGILDQLTDLVKQGGKTN